MSQVDTRYLTQGKHCRKLPRNQTFLRDTIIVLLLFLFL